MPAKDKGHRLRAQIKWRDGANCHSATCQKKQHHDGNTTAHQTGETAQTQSLTAFLVLPFHNPNSGQNLFLSAMPHLTVPVHRPHKPSVVSLIDFSRTGAAPLLSNMRVEFPGSWPFPAGVPPSRTCSSTDALRLRVLIRRWRTWFASATREALK